ncbi:hypothetical protein ACHAO1_000793 [Botrytis cinerea]
MEDEFCKKVDLNLTININLLADAPQGHPHLLNVKRPQKNHIAPKIEKHKSRRIEFPEDLSLVDVLVTIFFDWKPAALHHLLNVEDEQFYCAAKLERTLRYESWDRFIVNRLGQYVRIATVGIVPGTVVSYRICNNKKWEIISARNYDTDKNCTYLVPSDPLKKCACEQIEKKMAQLIFQKILVDVVLQDRIFPVLIYEPEAKSKKGKESKGCTTSEPNDVELEPNTGSSSDILMEGNLNAKVAELEAQVSALQKSIKELTGPARKRRRED